MGLAALLKTGGISMYPLLLCSLAIWAIAFEKLWNLRKFQKEYKRLFERAEELAKNKKLEEIRGLFQSAATPMAAPALALLDGEAGKVRRRLLETQAVLKQYMWIVGTVGASAPFIGLFGTVLGIIRSFDAIANSGKSGFAVVASGLSEALLATAIGIIIAVIAVIFYNYFNSRISSINLDFKNKLEDLADTLGIK